VDRPGGVARLGGGPGIGNGDGGLTLVLSGDGQGTGAGGAVRVAGGDGGQVAGDGGAVTIDSGASPVGTAGTITIGATDASAVAIGRSGITTDFPAGSTVDFTGATVTGLASGGAADDAEAIIAHAIFV